MVCLDWGTAGKAGRRRRRRVEGKIGSGTAIYKLSRYQTWLRAVIGHRALFCSAIPREATTTYARNKQT